MSLIDIKKLLPRVLRNDFWNDFLDTVSDELTNLQTEIAKKVLHFNVRQQTDEDRLIEYSDEFGYTIDRSLNQSLEYLKREVRSVPFRIQYKTTYSSYKHIYKSIPYTGETFIYYWNTTKLVKAYDNTNVFTLLDAHNLSTPFTFPAEENFALFLFSDIFLDASPVFQLDVGGWFLDQEISKVSTKHIAPELVVDTLIFDSDTQKYYSMTKEYMDYLYNAVEYTRKTVEVPHNGCQITGFMDESNDYDAALIPSNIFKGTTNLITDPEDLTTVNWTDNNTTSETSSYIEGDANFTKITSNAASNSYVSQSFSISGTAQAIQAIFKRGTTNATVSKLVLIDDISTNIKAEITIDFTTDSISLSGSYGETHLLYKWLDSDTVWVSCKSATTTPANTHSIYIYPDDGTSGTDIYVTAIQVENYDYQTTYVNGTRNDVNLNDSFTLPNQFSFKIKLNKCYFPYDSTNNYKSIISWYIGASNKFLLKYDIANDKFIIDWVDGTTLRTLESQQFDDGTSFDDLTQEDIVIFGSFDLTTGTTSGSRLVVITDQQTYEDSTWSGNIDTLSSSFTTLSLGNENNTNYADSIIDYLYIYNNTITDSFTTERELDIILETKTLSYSRDFPTYDYATDFYTIPKIKLKSTTLAAYSTSNNIEKMVIGTGVQTLPGVYNSAGSLPTSLSNQIAEVDLHIDETSAGANWFLYYSEFQANKILSEVLDTGDGSTTAFSGTFTYFPILPGFIEIQYTSGTTTYIINDSKKNGKLLTDTDLEVGTINYTTGAFSFDTYEDIYNEIAASGAQSSISYNLINTPVVTNTVKILYYFAGVPYIATDDGAGNITGTNISTGAITYSTGAISITFSGSTDVGKDITVDYNFEAPPVNLTDIVANNYSLTEDADLEITEAGLIDENGDLVTYMTFPPVKMDDHKYHLGLNWFIYKGNY